MAENPDQTGAPGGGEEAKPWPVVSRSMINYDPGTMTNLPVGRDQSPRRGPQGPGLVLVLVGLVLSALALVEWASILVQVLRRQGFADALGPVLPSGLPVGVVHAFAFFTGVLLVLTGTAIRRMGTRIWWQLAFLVLSLVLVEVLVILVLGGAPPSTLLPWVS